MRPAPFVAPGTRRSTKDYILPLIFTNRSPRWMSSLHMTDKLVLEEYLGMSSGYVLNFSDRTFGEFVRFCSSMRTWSAALICDV